jgi:hypothetical protein
MRRSSTFAVPGALAAASGAGLILALLGDGWFDALGWIALAAPLLAIAFAVFRRSRR